MLTDHPRPGLIRLTLNRPDVLNAIDWGVLEELEEAVDAIEGDASLRALIITGAGDRAFCSGADLNVVRTLDATAVRKWASAGHRIFGKLARSRVPTIAAIRGYCLGGGLELALSCDLRFPAQDAVFGFPEMSHGWIPGWGGIPMLSRTIGAGRAREIIMTGERFTAERAWRVGICRRPVTVRELETASLDLAEQMASLGPGSLKALKTMLPAGPPEVGSDASEIEIKALQEQLGERLAGADERE